MNRVFKITAHNINRYGNLEQVKKRVYESQKKFETHCLSDRYPNESTYERYSRLYHQVKLWELIEDTWVELTEYEHEPNTSTTEA
jgi:hypothetical protein